MEKPFHGRFVFYIRKFLFDLAGCTLKMR